jgi:hypothetical protein
MAPEQMEAAEYLPDVTYERATNGKNYEYGRSSRSLSNGRDIMRRI